MTDIKLEDLKSELQQRGLSPSLRSGGRAAFLFVEHDGKAVEIPIMKGNGGSSSGTRVKTRMPLRRKTGSSLHPVRPSTRLLAGSCSALKEAGAICRT